MRDRFNNPSAIAGMDTTSTTGNVINGINATPLETDVSMSHVPYSQKDDKPRTMYVDAMYTSEEAWKVIETIGERIVHFSWESLVCRALVAGFYVGIGGILTTSVGFDIDGVMPWMPGSGYQRLLSGAIGYPLTIFLATITGNGAWTGDKLLIAVAYWNKRCTLGAAIRFLLITYCACMFSCFLMGMFAVGADLPAVQPCRAFAEHKLQLTTFQLFLRGIGGGALINLAVYLQTCARTMTGKWIGIWLPISTYVICDMEHCLATMFTLSVASMLGAHITLFDYLRVLVPGTVGNLVGGMMFVGIGISNVPRKSTVSSRPPAVETVSSFVGCVV